MSDKKQSSTALRVLEGVLYASSHAQLKFLVSKVAKAAAKTLIRGTPDGEKRLRYLESWRFRRMVPILEWLLLPGASLHYALRKKYIEERIRGLLNEGYTQVVNLGAGFDTLALRFHDEFPHVHFVEVDHPASQKAKLRALEGRDLGSNLEFVPVDFTHQTVHDRLSESGFDAARRTAFICEGVLAYLDREETQTLFRSLRDLAGVGTEVVFTFIARESPRGHAPYGPLLGLYLRLGGEPVRFQIDPDEMSGFLSPLGYVMEEIVSGPELLEREKGVSYRGAVHDLEHMAIARCS